MLTQPANFKTIIHFWEDKQVFPSLRTLLTLKRNPRKSQLFLNVIETAPWKRNVKHVRTGVWAPLLGVLVHAPYLLTYIFGWLFPSWFAPAIQHVFARKRSYCKLPLHRMRPMWLSLEVPGSLSFDHLSELLLYLFPHIMSNNTLFIEALLVDKTSHRFLLASVSSFIK